MIRQSLTDQFLQGGIKIGGVFQHIGKFPQLLRHDGVQGDVGPGDGLGGAQHPQLKLVAGEGQGAGAVAVGGIPGDGRQDIHADAEHALFRLGVVGAVDDGVDDGGKLVAQVDGDNGGRGFAGSQAVIVARGSHGAAQEILVFVHTGDEGCQEHQEPGVLAGSFAGAEQVFTGIRG